MSTRADVVKQSALEGGEGEGVAEQWGGGWSFVLSCIVSLRPVLSSDRAGRVAGCSWAAAGRGGGEGDAGRAASHQCHVTSQAAWPATVTLST